MPWPQHVRVFAVENFHMNITMPKCGYDIPVPEPDPKQPEENISNEIIIPADISSEDDDDNDEDDAPENHG